MPHRSVQTPNGAIPVYYEVVAGGDWLATAEVDGEPINASGKTIQEAHEAIAKRILARLAPEAG